MNGAKPLLLLYVYMACTGIRVSAYVFSPRNFGVHGQPKGFAKIKVQFTSQRTVASF
jgi:hypothetical protein